MKLRNDVFMKSFKNILAIVALFAIGSVSAMEREESSEEVFTLPINKATEQEMKTFIDNKIDAAKTKLTASIKNNNPGEFAIAFNPVVKAVAIKFFGDVKARNLLENAIYQIIDRENSQYESTFKNQAWTSIGVIFDNMEHYL